jgi:hypothetical protein
VLQAHAEHQSDIPRIFRCVRSHFVGIDKNLSDPTVLPSRERDPKRLPTKFSVEDFVVATVGEALPHLSSPPVLECNFSKQPRADVG